MDVDLDELRFEHFKAYMLIRKVGEIGLRRECKKSVSSKALAEWQGIIDAAINGERVALGMKYLDLNIAIEELTKMGYIVTEGTEDDVARIGLNNGELKITSEMLKEFYKTALQNSTNGSATPKE